jgi:hypothetical protein
VADRRHHLLTWAFLWTVAIVYTVAELVGDYRCARHAEREARRA